MNLGMAVGKSDRAGFVMIDGRLIARTGNRGQKHKTIIKTQRVFICENDTIRRGQPGVEIRELFIYRIPEFYFASISLFAWRGSDVTIRGTGPHTL